MRQEEEDAAVAAVMAVAETTVAARQRVAAFRAALDALVECAANLLAATIEERGTFGATWTSTAAEVERARGVLAAQSVVAEARPRVQR